MARVITFRDPVLRDVGVSNVRIARIVVDIEESAVKVILKQTDANGVFLPNGKTHAVLNTGQGARTIIQSDAYRAILEALPDQLVAGNRLPGPADVREVVVDVPMDRGDYFELKSLLLLMQIARAEFEAAKDRAHAKLPEGIDRTRNFVLQDASCAVVQE